MTGRVILKFLPVVALVATFVYVAATELARVEREQVERELFAKNTKPSIPNVATSSDVNFDKPPPDTRTVNFQHSLSAGTSKSSAQPKRKQDGIEKGKARFVVYYDYENSKCRELDKRLQDLLVRYPDSVSIVARHYPAAANNNAPLDSLASPNACRMNLMTEAARHLKGDEGFWRVHHWLMTEDQSRVDDAQIALAIGLSEAAEFQEAVRQPQCLSRVFSDVVEARSMGVQSAPTVLLNGSRLTEISSDSLELATRSAIEQAFEKNTNESLSVSESIDPKALHCFPHDQQLSAAMATVRVVNPNGRTVGSGVIFASRGTFVYALTASHLTTNSKNVEVQTFSPESYPKPAKTHSWAAVVATSESSDLAVIRFSTRESISHSLQLAPLASSDDLSEFESLTTGCNGMEAPPTCLTNKVVASRKLRRNAASSETFMWETQISSAEGRSGGALLDKNGAIIGIASGNSDDKGYFSHSKEIYRLLDDNGLTELLAHTE